MYDYDGHIEIELEEDLDGTDFDLESIREAAMEVASGSCVSRLFTSDMLAETEIVALDGVKSVTVEVPASSSSNHSCQLYTARTLLYFLQ